jgi:putative transcription factor
MPCELCGRDVKGCKLAIIDGAKIRVCPDCIKYAEGVPEEAKPTPPPVQRFLTQRTHHPPQPRDIYKDITKDLVTDWNHKIEDARKRKGLTRQELGFRIGERTVTIQKIENGDLRPSDQTIAKLEKELQITLLEAVTTDKTTTTPTTTHTPSTAYTLGNFVKTKQP